MLKNTVASLLFALAISSCSKEEKINKNVPPPELSAKTSTDTKNCGYVINEPESSIEWSAFKFTNRTEVEGEFEKFNFNSKNLSNATIEELFKGLTFSIDVSSLDTEDGIRDNRILNIFFKSFTNKKPITGIVQSLKDNEALVSITMNNITKDVILPYKIDDNKIDFKGLIDLNNWNGENAMKALNDACYQLHTGTDGKSKLWNEVEIKISTELNKVACD